MLVQAVGVGGQVVAERPGVQGVEAGAQAGTELDRFDAEGAGQRGDSFLMSPSTKQRTP